MKYTTADRLKQIMKERGLKQVDIIRSFDLIGSASGEKIRRSDMSQYVSGKVVPGSRKLTILAMALDVSETWLMGYDVPMGRYDNMDSEDAEFVRSLGYIKPKEKLPENLEAANVLLHDIGEEFMSVDGVIYLGECGQMTEEEIDFIIESGRDSMRSAINMIKKRRFKP